MQERNRNTDKRAGIGQGNEATGPRLHSQPARRPVQKRTSGKVWNVQDKGNTPFSPVKLRAVLAFLFGRFNLPDDLMSLMEEPGAPTIEHIMALAYQPYVGAYYPAFQEYRCDPSINAACAALGFRAADVLEVIIRKNEAQVQRGEYPAVALFKYSDALFQGIAADPVLIVESVLELLDWQFEQRRHTGSK